MKASTREALVRALPGVLALVVGLGVLGLPWWSATLPAKLHPVLMVFGAALVGFGGCVLVPDRWPRVQSLAIMMFTGALGLVMAAMVFAPLHPDPDGTYTIAGIPGFRSSVTHSIFGLSMSSFGGGMPWWARVIAGFFMLICLAIALLSAWGVVRRSSRPDTYDAR